MSRGRFLGEAIFFLFVTDFPVRAAAVFAAARPAGVYA